MNQGLMRKSAREVWLGTLLFAVALGVTEALLSFVIPTLLSTYGEQILQMEFVQRIIAALLGLPPTTTVSAVMAVAFPWVHPVVLAILWITAIWLGTRIPVGEIDRGTVDILLSLPISRAAVLVNDAVVSLVAGVLVVACAAIGHVAGNRLAASDTTISLFVTMGIAVNLLAMYVAVLGLTYLTSACSERRGRAVGLTLALVLASFFLSFLAQFWSPAKQVEALGIMNYFRPMHAVQKGGWAILDIIILVGFGMVSWTVALGVFVRRDIRTS